LANITGTAANDTLTGTELLDFINGLGGDDVINGLGGDDVIDAGLGNDIVNGGDGNDNILGGGGDDQLFGDAGNDTIALNVQVGGTSLLDGGSGDDRLTVFGSGLSTVRGGAGNDIIRLDGFGITNADGGDGNDVIELGSSRSSTLTLGAGADLVTTLINYAPTSPTIILDFVPGEDQVRLPFAGLLLNWQGSGNPFGQGYARLVQGFGAVVLELDRDGGGNGYGEILRFFNTSLAAFGAAAFSGYAPDGSAPAAQTLNGTAGSDVLTGGIGNDQLSGLDGIDRLDGAEGDDTLFGGNGNDVLEDRVGANLAYGEAGNDTIFVAGASQAFGGDDDDNLSGLGNSATAIQTLLDGGAGNDTITFFNGQFGSSNGTIIRGGDGNDEIRVDGFSLNNQVDGGSGNDRITVGSALGLTLTLGSGADVIIISEANFAPSAAVVITDFNVAEDRIEHSFFRYFTGWAGAENPFGEGFLRLISNGPDAVVQRDRDGVANGVLFTDLFVFRNISPAALTAAVFGGFAPDGSPAISLTVTGTAGNDVLVGGVGSDLIEGLGGNDTLNGGIGNDTLDGGDGDDRLEGGAGNDTLRGGNGNDRLEAAQGGIDQLFGGAGNDTLTAFGTVTGAPTLLDGGDGDDLLQYSNSQFGSTNGSIARGGAGNDQIDINGFGPNIIDAGPGNDTVNLGSGLGYQVALGDGADTLTIGINFVPSTAAVISDFLPGTDRMTINFAPLLTNWNGTNPFASGHARLLQQGANVLLQFDPNGGGEAYLDRILFLNAQRGSFAFSDFGGFDFTVPAVRNSYPSTDNGEEIIGGEGSDFIDGRGGNDTIQGRGGNDELFGGAGDDRIIGGAGNDLINGGVGRDTVLFSGTMADYEFSLSGGALIIRDRRTNGDGIDTLFSIERVVIDGLDISLTSFAEPGDPRVANFTVGAGGWSTQERFPRILADVNGDGLADIVGFGQAGTLVALGQANGNFAAPFVAVANFGQDQGWSSANIFHRELADVNGDGRDDIVGFGTAGVLVSLAQVGGTFGAPILGSTNFNPANGWTSQDAFARTLADVNGDGFADIIGFGVPGSFVALGTGTGSFGAATFARADFGANQGWTSNNQFHREVGDVNGDGRADIVGFGQAGTLVALGQANGSFGGPALMLGNFGTSQGWTSQDLFPRDLADVNGDGLADIVGFGVAGTLLAAGQADGSFSTASFELANFGRNQGWSSDNIFHRELADVNGDGRADIVGFGQSGVFAALAFSGLVI